MSIFAPNWSSIRTTCSPSVSNWPNWFFAPLIAAPNASYTSGCIAFCAFCSASPSPRTVPVVCPM